MVPNPNSIYEEPQYEIVHPELNTLTTSHQTADTVASVDNPFYQVVPTHEVTQALRTVVGEPSQGSGDESRSLAGTDPSNDNYIAMNPIGTLGTLV